MSTSLQLKAPRNRLCDLIQTTSTETEAIFRHGDSRYETLIRYFSWLDTYSGLSAGAVLDHKLFVALFLVQNPDAEWSAV